MAQKLPCYLRTYRKRGGLTQSDLAFLLGSDTGTTVSHYERLLRDPNLDTAFACQVIFGIPAQELFPGVYGKVEKAIRRRAHVLSQKVQDGDMDARIKHKMRLLDAIVSGNGAAPEHDV